jgi:hypothetical protein
MSPKAQSTMQLPPSVINGLSSTRRSRGAQPAAESDDLHRQRYHSTQSIDQLALVDGHDHACRGTGHDLLAQQSPTQTFDHVQRVPRHLIGTVDDYIDAAMRGEGREAETQLLRQCCGPIGCRDAQHSQATGDPRRQRRDHEDGRGAAA